jgi:hypothetical protein
MPKYVFTSYLYQQCMLFALNREATTPIGEKQKELQYTQPLTRSAMRTLQDVPLRYRPIWKPAMPNTSRPAVTLLTNLWKVTQNHRSTHTSKLYIYCKTITYFSIQSEDSSHSEITDLQIIVFIQQEILWLQITMCNTTAMKVLLVINTPHERLILVTIMRSTDMTCNKEQFLHSVKVIYSQLLSAFERLRSDLNC